MNGFNFSMGTPPSSAIFCAIFFICCIREGSSVVDPATEGLLPPFLDCERLAETGCSSSSESEKHLRLLPTDDSAVVGLTLPDALEDLVLVTTEETRPPSRCFPFAEPLGPPTDREADRPPVGPVFALPVVVRTAKDENMMKTDGTGLKDENARQARRVLVCLHTQCTQHHWQVTCTIDHCKSAVVLN